MVKSISVTQGEGGAPQGMACLTVSLLSLTPNLGGTNNTLFAKCCFVMLPSHLNQGGTNILCLLKLDICPHYHPAMPDTKPRMYKYNLFAKCCYDPNGRNMKRKQRTLAWQLVDSTLLNRIRYQLPTTNSK